MSEIMRPLDLLNASKGKDVIVQLKFDKQIVGKLLAFDININLVLDNAKELGDKPKGLGLLFVRGDSVIFVSPSS